MKPHTPTDGQRFIVKEMGEVGVPRKLIAAQIGISEATLYKYYKDVLDMSMAHKLQLVGNALFVNAIEHMSFPAQKFIMACQAGWREASSEDAAASMNEDIPITKITHKVLEGIDLKDLEDKDDDK